MITEVILPKLGQTMEEGAIVEWIKQEGDPVNRGDLLFTVESDKAVLDVEATARGFLRKILVPAGQAVPVLTAVALMTREADEDIGGYPGSGVQVSSRPGTEVIEPEPVAVMAAAEQVGRAGGRIFASPRARKTAREKEVDLALVTGTGPNGRIVEQDVLDYLATQPQVAPLPEAAPLPELVPLPKVTPMARKTAEALGVDVSAVTGTGIGGRVMQADVAGAGAAATPAAPTVERVPLTGIRGIIAERMATSHATAARVTLVTEADATALVQVREQLQAAVSELWGFSPGYNDLLGLIVARALGEYPYMNARLSEDGQEIERLPYVNLGLAVDTERGLLVPVVRDANNKGLQAFGSELRTLVERARLGRSLPDDLSGGTFTITNLGMYEIDAFTPIINLPEAAILGVGRIQPKSVVLGPAAGGGSEWEVGVRQMWTLSLVFDHRLVDGAPAARFLQRIKHLIEQPYLLLG